MTVLDIHYNIQYTCIRNFFPYYAYANSEESGKLFLFKVYMVYGYIPYTWRLNRVFWFK